MEENKKEIKKKQESPVKIQEKTPTIYDRFNTIVSEIDDYFGHIRKEFDKRWADAQKYLGELETKVKASFSSEPIIKGEDDKYLLTWDLKAYGIKEKDLHLFYDNGVLQVKASYERKTEHGVRKGSLSFAHIFKGINEDKMEADFKKGVLSVYLPKKDAPRKIPIKTEK